MRNLHPIVSACVLISLFILPSCNRERAWQEEADALIIKAANLEALHARLNNRIDSLWDQTTTQIEQALPENFPEVDRGIFLNSRNADHIRMFMSFKLLDEETQALVDKAGKEDAMLASQVHALKIQREDFEKQKLQFLQKIQQENEKAGRIYTDKFRLASASHY